MERNADKIQELLIGYKVISNTAYIMCFLVNLKFQWLLP